MSIRTKSASTVFTGVAAAGMTAFAAAPAMATASWNVAGGGPIRLHNPGPIVIRDNNAHSTITCAASRVNLTGTAKTGSPVRNPVVTISGGTFGTATAPCKAGAGFSFKGHVVGTWDLSATSQSSGGLVHVKITNIHESTSGLGIAAGCKFSVTGSANGNYSNTAGSLSVTSARLTIHGATGCLGHFNNDDTVTFAGQLSIKNAAGGHPVITHV